jgi:hypothetical protein
LGECRVEKEKEKHINHRRYFGGLNELQCLHVVFVTAEISSEVCGSDKRITCLGNWRKKSNNRRWLRNELLGQKQIERW